MLLAAVGGPKWDTTDPSAPRPEQGLLGLRKGLGLFANLRPVRPSPALIDASPLKPDRIKGTDLLVVRELTGGIYFGDSGREGDRAHDDCAYTRGGGGAHRPRGLPVGAYRGHQRGQGQRDGDVPALARDRDAGGAEEFPDVPLNHLLVDNAAMQLVANPSSFDVIVTENLFGDILSDEAAMLTGSLGMLPSASLGDGGPGLFEPVHGSAPDIAGTGSANPMAMFGSVALMLRHGLAMEPAAARIESAVDLALEQGIRTPDLGGEATTEDVTTAVLAKI